MIGGGMRKTSGGAGDDLQIRQSMVSNEDNEMLMDVDETMQGQDEILKHIHQLKYGDLSKRVDSLVSLNELIS